MHVELSLNPSLGLAVSGFSRVRSDRFTLHPSFELAVWTCLSLVRVHGYD
jgi:hypothetical protein